MLAVALLGAGCTTQPDLRKATFQRSTIPATGASASLGNSGTGANDAAFTLAKLREIDPCGLLGNNTLAALGTPDTAIPDGLDSCADSMKDRNGNDLDITVTLGSSITDKPTTVVFGLPVAEHEISDGSGCFERIITQDNPAEGIELEAEGRDPCTPARKLAQSVVATIRSNPPKRSGFTGSLAAQDPCLVVDDQTAADAVGGNPDKSRDSLYKCDWQGSDTDLTVTFTTAPDPKTDDALGTPRPVDIGGITAYQVLSTDVFPSCEVKWTIRALPDGSGDAEIVDVEFDNINKINVDTCAKAVTVARVVVPNVPKPS